MGFIQMGCIEEAVESLIYTHNYPMGDENSEIKVSFSKNRIINTWIKNNYLFEFGNVKRKCSK